MEQDMEHLVLMEHVLSCELPRAMLKEASTAGDLRELVAIDSKGRLQASNLDSEAMEFVQRARLLQDRVLHQQAELLALLQGLLKPDPKYRLSADDAMRLPFITSNSIQE